MKPTAHLRFVERSVPMHPFYKTTDAEGNLVQATQTYRVLQQWWTTTLGDEDDFIMQVNGGWRDVPLEKEE